MATDVPAQRPDIVAKDILIAALESDTVHVKGTTPQELGESLATMYNAILDGIKTRGS